MSNLTKKKCGPCSKNTPKLSMDEIQNKLSEINDWNLNDSKEMIFKKCSILKKIMQTFK